MFLWTTKIWRIWKKENWKRKIYLGGILCVSTMIVRIKTSACIIRRGCWCPRNDIVARPSILQLGRTASADVSVKRNWWRRHGASRGSMITFLNGRGRRLADACTHCSEAETAPIIGRITVRTCCHQKSRRRFLGLSPGSAASKVSSLIITLRTGTLTNCCWSSSTSTKKIK